jgi:hypothetical protein
MGKKQKMCNKLNCPKQATYGNVFGRPICCKKHKDDDMIDAKHRTCEDCTKRPNYGTEFGKPTHCVEHKSDDMYDVTHTKCEYLGCKIRPNYGNDLGKPTHCKDHKSDDMYDVTHTKCEYLGCKIRPNYGNDLGKPTHCKDHKSDDMYNVKDKKCEYPNCTTIPTFGIELGKATHCKEHRSIDMYNVKDKKCTYSDCVRNPYYGTHLTGKVHCSTHYDKSKEWKLTLCKHTKCRKYAIWSKSGTFPYEFCDNHVPLDGYKSTFAGKCKNCGLNDLILDEDQKCLLSCTIKHKDYTKFSETEMDKVFTTNKFKYTRDKTVDTSCSLKRPDFVFDWGYGILIVENDENQHKSRPCECEQTRMIQIHNDYGGLPVHFIRFNPDKYKTQSGKSVENLDKRLQFLCNIIKKNHKDAQQFFERNTNLTVSYLYYDNFDNLYTTTPINYI